MFESTLSRPWRVRQVLYLVAALFTVGLVVIEPNWRTFIVAVLAVGGVVSSLGTSQDDDPGSVHLGIMGGYDLGVAVVLAALGLQFTSIVILIAATAAVALLRPQWRVAVTVAAASGGAAVALATVTVGGRASLVPPVFEGPILRTFIPMANMAVVTAGLAWLFSSVGTRLHLLSTAQEALRRSLDSKRAPTFVVDGDRIVYANPAAAVFAGRALVDSSLVETLGLTGPFEPGARLRTTVVSTADARIAVEVQTDPITFDARPHTQVTVLSVEDHTAGSLPSQAPPRLDLLFDRIPVALYRSAPSGEVLAANPALIDLLGLDDPDQLLSGLAQVERHYRDRDGRNEWLEMFDDRDVVLRYPIELTTADGRVIHAEDSARAIRDKNGAILFFEGVMIDVTRQRETEEAWRRNSEILEATSDMVWLTDPDDRIFRVNASMRRFLDGSPDAELHGSSVNEFVAEGAQAGELRAWRNDPDAPREWRGEIVLRSRQGEEILTSTVAQRHRGFVSVVARDITTERRTARQLEALMEAKDEFIASVSHELRTPLTAVVGLAAELAANHDSLDDVTKREFIRLVADQSAEVAAIVEDLLVAARADTDSITLMNEQVDVRRAVDSVLEALGRERAASFEVRGDGTARGDAQRIRQIVRNLVTNAIRYGELPGTIAISSVDDEVIIKVADKGEGIDAQMVERIFQPYVRAHTAATQPNSVGLGLSVSRWLAEK
ncbi:MAG: PAS domain S-box protein, partial [Acidimicrobiia bacterium]|nr:PAS domain S-box protein [Acidimicrobiia bacterium]